MGVETARGDLASFFVKCLPNESTGSSGFWRACCSHCERTITPDSSMENWPKRRKKKNERKRERERERIVVDREDRKTEWLIVVETAARVFSPLSRCEEREIQQWRKMKSIRLRDTEIFFLAFIRFRGRHWCDDNKVPGLGKKGRWRLRYPWKVAKTWNFFKKKGGFCFEKFFLKLEFSRCVFSR